MGKFFWRLFRNLVGIPAIFYYAILFVLLKKVSGYSSVASAAEDATYDLLKEADPNVFDEGFFEAISERYKEQVQNLEKSKRLQNLTILLAILLSIGVIDKFSFSGVELRLNNLIFLCVIANAFLEVRYYWHSFKSSELSMMLRARCRLVTEGNNTDFYKLRYVNIGSQMSRDIEKSLTKENLTALYEKYRPTRFFIISGVGSLVVLAGLFPIYTIVYHTVLIAIYIEALFKNTLSIFVSVPLLTFSLAAQIAVRTLLIGSAFGIKEKKEKQLLAEQSVADAGEGAPHG